MTPLRANPLTSRTWSSPAARPVSERPHEPADRVELGSACKLGAQRLVRWLSWPGQVLCSLVGMPAGPVLQDPLEERLGQLPFALSGEKVFGRGPGPLAPDEAALRFREGRELKAPQGPVRDEQDLQALEILAGQGGPGYHPVVQLQGLESRGLTFRSQDDAALSTYRAYQAVRANETFTCDYRGVPVIVYDGWLSTYGLDEKLQAVEALGSGLELVAHLVEDVHRYRPEEVERTMRRLGIDEPLQEAWEYLLHADHRWEAGTLTPELGPQTLEKLEKLAAPTAGSTLAERLDFHRRLRLERRDSAARKAIEDTFDGLCGQGVEPAEVTAHLERLAALGFEQWIEPGRASEDRRKLLFQRDLAENARALGQAGSRDLFVELVETGHKAGDALALSQVEDPALARELGFLVKSGSGRLAEASVKLATYRAYEAAVAGGREPDQARADLERVRSAVAWYSAEEASLGLEYYGAHLARHPDQLEAWLGLIQKDHVPRRDAGPMVEAGVDLSVLKAGLMGLYLPVTPERIQTVRKAYDSLREQGLGHEEALALVEQAREQLKELQRYCHDEVPGFEPRVYAATTALAGDPEGLALYHELLAHYRDPDAPDALLKLSDRSAVKTLSGLGLRHLTAGEVERQATWLARTGQTVAPLARFLELVDKDLPTEDDWTSAVAFYQEAQPEERGWATTVMEKGFRFSVARDLVELPDRVPLAPEDRLEALDAIFGHKWVQADMVERCEAALATRLVPDGREFAIEQLRLLAGAREPGFATVAEHPEWSGEQLARFVTASRSGARAPQAHELVERAGEDFDRLAAAGWLQLKDHQVRLAACDFFQRQPPDVAGERLTALASALGGRSEEDSSACFRLAGGRYRAVLALVQTGLAPRAVEAALETKVDPELLAGVLGKQWAHVDSVVALSQALVVGADAAALKRLFQASDRSLTTLQALEAGFPPESRQHALLERLTESLPQEAGAVAVTVLAPSEVPLPERCDCAEALAVRTADPQVLRVAYRGFLQLRGLGVEAPQALALVEALVGPDTRPATLEKALAESFQLVQAPAGASTVEWDFGGVSIEGHFLALNDPS